MTVSGGEFCPWHDPAMAGKRAEWSSKGGVNRSNAEVHSYLSLAFRFQSSPCISAGCDMVQNGTEKALNAFQSAPCIERKRDHDHP